MTEERIPKRRQLREAVMQSLYALELSKDSPEHIIGTILEDLKKNESDYDFAVTLFLTTVNHQAEIDKEIKKKAEHWEFHRIALIDKLLLRMAMSEIIYFNDIPPKVSINEAIEISKDYSTDSSGTFINGILDALLNDMKKDGSLKKTGRGLLETKKKTNSSH
jgi:transcription antitermination protein NusB